jgi:hypothetical protein
MTAPVPTPAASTDVALAPVPEPLAVQTTAGLSEYARLLAQARVAHAQTYAELERARLADRHARDELADWHRGWFLKRFMKSRLVALEDQVQNAAAQLAELEEQERLSKLSTQLDVPVGVAAVFADFTRAFTALSQCSKIWDTVGSRALDARVERTVATRVVEREPVTFRLGACPVIDSDWHVPHLENANGGDLYLFPLFVVYFASDTQFALLEYREVQAQSSALRFMESEAVPADAQVVGTTWAKTNRDGSPDRRFKGNHEIPITEYGKLMLSSAGGLREEYAFSQLAPCQAFSQAWQRLTDAIATGQ